MSRRLIISIGLLFSSACGIRGEADDIPRQSEDALSATNEQCDSIAPNKTLKGGGAFTSDRAYSHSKCASGYLLDLDGYDAKYDAGTLAAYADPPPTNQTDCTNLQMRVYVWRRNANATRTYLGGAFPRGEWVTDSWGQGHCKTPSVLVDSRITGYTRGGNYRLGMRAQALDAQGNVVKKRIFFKTMKKPLPVLPGHVVADAIASFQRLPSSGIALNLNQTWMRKRGWTNGPLCRDLGLKLSFEKVSVPAYTKLGATEQKVRDRLAKEESVYNLLCNTPLASSEQQLTFYADVRASLSLTKQIFEEMSANTGLPMHDVAFALGRLLTAMFDKVLSQCGTQFGEVANFLHDGALPAGLSGPNVLFRNCNQTTAGMTTLLGSTFGLGGSRANVRSCVEDALTTGQGLCNDPRAQTTDTGEAPAVQDTTSEDDVCDGDAQCKAELVQNADVDFDLLSQIDQVKGDQARALGALRVVNIEQTTAEREASALITIAHEVVALGDSIEAAGGEAGEEIRQAGVELLIETLQTSEVLDAEYERRSREADEHLQDAQDTLNFLCGSPMTAATRNLAKCPTGALCPGFDFAGGSRGWYASAPDEDGRTRPQNVYDRVNHCLCQALGNRMPGCDDPTERQKQDCLANPLGPDDGPRRECVQFMQPADIDRDAIEARICTLVRPNCGSFDMLLDVNNRCGCGTGTGQAGSPVSPRCAEVIRCPEDAVLDEQTCRCQPLNAGGTPFVQPPGCAVSAAGRPGGIDKWMLSSVDAVNLNRVSVPIDGQTQVRDTLQFERGNVAAAAPVFRTQDYATMGSRLFADVLIPTQAPASGWRGLAQAHITVGNVFNDFVGQTELSTLSPGVRRVEFNVPSNVQTLLRQPDRQVRITYVLNTDVRAPVRTSIVNFGFSGSAISTPNPSDPCPIISGVPAFPFPFTPLDPGQLPNWPFRFPRE